MIERKPSHFGSKLYAPVGIDFDRLGEHRLHRRHDRESHAAIVAHAARSVLALSVLAAGQRDADAEPDQREPADAADRGEPPRRPGEPGLGGAGGHPPERVGHHCHRHEHQSEQQQLDGRVAGGGIGELRHHGADEHQRLDVRDADDESVPRGAPRRRCAVQVADRGEAVPVPDRPDTQEDQVAGADELQHGDRRDRSFEHRADAEGNGDDLDVLADGVAGDGGQRGTAPVGDRAADDERHARSRDHQLHQAGEGERREQGGRDHAAILGTRIGGRSSTGRRSS